MMIAPHAVSGRCVIVSLALLVLAGCAGRAPKEDRVSYEPVYPIAPEQMERSAGAIYASGGDVRLFEDLRARRVGDILTIRLSERTNATKSASTSTSKTTAVDVDNPTLGGRPLTASGTNVLDNVLNSDHSFSGEGDSSQSNSLQGSVTVSVARVLANGYLEVRGEKWIRLNQGDEYVRISGIVRPYDIEPDNSVSSEKVAGARIAYSGKGALADANAQGWLARFFNKPWMPF